jgi:ABC-type multidrug transport system ATPase subunit
MELDLRGISKKVGAQTWLYGLDLALRPGAVTILLGATRAGKTSLMRIMAGLRATGSEQNPSHASEAGESAEAEAGEGDAAAEASAGLEATKL